MKSRFATLIAGAATLMASAAAFAAGYVDIPKNGQLWLPEPASPTADKIEAFHELLLVIITIISVFVLLLMLYTCWRFRESRNPNPSTTSHNSVIEVIWTVVPVIVLVAIAIPSFRLLYFADHTTKADMTLKIIGNQWYWSYEYPDYGNFTFDANLIPRSEIKKGQLAQMDTDYPVVLPVGKKIRLLMTSRDVIHSWAISAFGVRLDNVPGRINETWVEIEKPGTYYGFCSELCGAGHAFMPIMVKAVSPADFATWVEKAKKEFARADEAPAVVPAKPVKLAERTAHN